MKKKNIGAIVTASILVLAALFMIVTGFSKRTDVALFDYSVSEDGTQLTFQAHVSTSMGYIRGFKDSGGGVKPHYLTFYSTFGGFNSSMGAKTTFVLELAPDDAEIYFNRPDNGFELVLFKDETTGQWKKASDTENAEDSETAETWDLIPMVMVNGELYLDTGVPSTIDGRCGMMDGEITSTVDGSKRPTEDDQSNFGSGYGYQYGATEGTIEILMNDKWWIYATEEVRPEIQFPSR